MLASILRDMPVPSLDSIERDVRDGMKRERDRWHAAWEANELCHLRNAQFLKSRPNEDDSDFRARPKRYSRLARKVVRLLSSQLWGRPPQRDVDGNPTVAKWYVDALASAQADVRLAAADRAATLGHASAIEVEATGDPARPFRLWVWRPHEFAVWCREDDPTDVWAVVTRSEVSAGPAHPGKLRKRLRAWSAAERRTFYSSPYGPGEPSAGLRCDLFEPDESGPSPYPGILPFTFVRHEPAVSEFWEGGIGQALVDANLYADEALCDLAQHLSCFLNPVAFARNVAANAELVHRPGQFMRLAGLAQQRAGDINAQPELGYLQATLAVETAWADLKAYVDQCLEELDIPATLMRSSDSSTDLSGVAIVAKQIPFYEQARTRQPFAKETESELFRVACGVVGTWHGSAELLAAAADPARLVVTWPEPQIPMPTAERDQSDQWELDAGLTDPIEVLARRRGITLNQAEELAEKIAERRDRWAELMGSLEPDMNTTASTDDSDPTASANAENAGEGPDTEDGETSE